VAGSSALTSASRAQPSGDGESKVVYTSRSGLARVHHPGSATGRRDRLAIFHTRVRGTAWSTRGAPFAHCDPASAPGPSTREPSQRQRRHDMSTVRICDVRRRLCSAPAEFGGGADARRREDCASPHHVGAAHPHRRGRAATIAAGLVLVAACESSDVDVRIRSVTGEPSSRSLSLGTATCNADLSADVEETAEEVRIRVHAENNTTNDCRDYMRLALDDALGDRSLIDDRTGEELRVMPPD
jgi:hypothetical protein